MASTPETSDTTVGPGQPCGPRARHPRLVRMIGTVLALIGTTLAFAPVAPASAADPSRAVSIVANNVRGPEAMVTGPDGNVWFVNRGSDSIGRITPAGVLSFFSDPHIHAPRGIAAGPDGNLWFGNDTAVNVYVGSIGRITTAGAVTVFPSAGSTSSMTAGPDGRMWFVTEDDTIGAITMTGVVTTYAGARDHVDGPRDIVTGPDGNLWFANYYGSTIGRITPGGTFLPPFSSPQITHPWTIASGPDGNVWYGNYGAASIGRITPAGEVTAFPLTSSQAFDLTSGPDGSLWFATAYTQQNRVGRITTQGVVTYYPVPLRALYVAAGPDGNVWFSSPDHVVGRVTPAGAVATFADPRVSGPTRITTGPDGNLWYTNQRGSSVGRVTPAGVTTTFTGPGVLAPYDITAGPDGNVWFTNFASIGRITEGGIVTKFSGPDIVAPAEITAGTDGNVWFTDPGHHSVGRITPTGFVTTFTSAELQKPTGITVNSDGNVWFTDIAASSISRILPNGTITTFAGRGNHPRAITAGPGGILYYGNAGDSSLRRLLANGDEEVVAGYPADIVDATDLTIDSYGTLWFNDARSPSHIGGIATSTLTGAPGQASTTAFIVPNPYALSGGGGGVTIGPDDHLWFTERDADAIGFTGTELVSSSTPTAVTASADDGAVGLQWSAPATGAPGINSYTVTPYIAGVAQAPVVLASPSTAAYIDGLTNGTTYTFTVTATTAAGTGPPSAPSPPVTPIRFHDVPVGAPFYADIDWLAAHNIASGFAGNYFDVFLPTAPVSRQAAAAFLYRYRGAPDGPAPTCSAAPFPDVPVGAPFCGEIRWLADTGIAGGIAGGIADGGFHPTAAVSRQAVAAFLYRLAGSPLGDHPPCPGDAFADVPAGAPFCGEITWLVDHGIAHGYVDGTFRPTAAVSRQAAAAFLHRFDAVGLP